MKLAGRDQRVNATGSRLRQAAQTGFWRIRRWWVFNPSRLFQSERKPGCTWLNTSSSIK